MRDWSVSSSQVSKNERGQHHHSRMSTTACSCSVLFSSPYSYYNAIDDFVLLIYCLNTVCDVFFLLLSVYVCEGDKGPQRMTNWGPAAFTDTELDLRKKSWQERKNHNQSSQ